MVEASGDGLLWIILKAQWERLLGSINDIIVVVAQEMETLGANICCLNPDFFSFRGEEKTFLDFFIIHVALTCDSPVPTSWVNLLPHCSHLGVE